MALHQVGMSRFNKQFNADTMAWCAVHADGPREEGIVSTAAAEKLHNTTELDYMTHIVLRMYENKKCAPPLVPPRSNLTVRFPHLCLAQGIRCPYQKQRKTQHKRECMAPQAMDVAVP